MSSASIRASVLADIRRDRELEVFDDASDEKLLKLQKDMNRKKVMAELARQPTEEDIKTARREKVMAELAQPEDSLLKNTGDVAQEIIQSFDKSVIQTADLAGSALRAPANFSKYLNSFLPHGGGLPEEGIGTIEDYLTDRGMLGNDYMEEGMGRDAVRGLGAALPMAAGFVPVARAGGATSSVVQDIAGLGMSVDDAAMVASKASVEAAKKFAKESDTVKLAARPENHEEIVTAARQSVLRQMVEGNKPQFEPFEQAKNLNEKAAAKVAKARAEGKDVADIADEHIPPEVWNTYDYDVVLKDLEELGVSAKDAAKSIVKAGGLDKIRRVAIKNGKRTKYLENSMEDLIHVDTFLTESENLKSFSDKVFTPMANGLEKIAGKTIADGFRKAAVWKETGEVNWLENLITPVSDNLSRYVSKGVGAGFDRAIVNATRLGSKLISSHGDDARLLAGISSKNKTLRNMILDIGRKPALIKDIRKLIKKEGGEPALKAFNRYIAMSSARGKEAGHKLYKTDSIDQDIYYFHTNKNAEAVKDLASSVKTGDGYEKVAPGAYMDRTRKLTSDMNKKELLELDMYDDPFLSHLKFLTEQDQLLEISKQLRLRPSLGRNGTSTDLFREAEAKMLRDGIPASKAKGGAMMMHSAFVGGKKAPPAFVRGFMSQSYAVLAQNFSAVLNLHDVPVAMVTQGVKNTLKSVIQSNKGVFGSSLEGMGMGNAQNSGEFVNNIEGFLTNPTSMDKFAKGAEWYTDKALTLSLFKAMDRMGKGVVLRASVNRMQAAAKSGNLHKEFSDVADYRELSRISGYLAKGMNPADMPKDIAEIVTEIAFTQLGKQQLISQSGRSLAYLNNPKMRPLWAMTGFAIKAQALLRKEVFDQVARGNYKEAAGYAARYSLYAGLGYGAIQETRTSLLKNEEFEAENILFGAVDQLGAVVSINKLGDSYSRAKFVDAPVDYILDSLVPPSGTLGGASTTMAAFLFKGEWDDAIVEQTPTLGTWYKSYWRDEDAANKKKAEKAKETRERNKREGK